MNIPRGRGSRRITGERAAATRGGVISGSPASPVLEHLGRELDTLLADQLRTMGELEQALGHGRGVRDRDATGLRSAGVTRRLRHHLDDDMLVS
jgi:hypothetical protein